MTIKYHAVTKVRGSLSGEVYPEYMEDRNTLAEAIDDARRDYRNTTSLDILAVVSIDMTTGDGVTIHNRKQLVDKFAAEELEEHFEEIEDRLYGTYADQMRGWAGAL